MSTMGNVGTIPPWRLGDRLARALDHSGISVQEMADELGVSRNTISNYKAGRTKVHRATLIVWALRTGVPLEWLENGETPAGPDGPDEGLSASREAVKLPRLDSNQQPSGSRFAQVRGLEQVA